MKTQFDLTCRLNGNWLQRACLALLLVLAGCGPGTGGTGTGTDSLPVGASAVDAFQWYLGPWGASNLVTSGPASTQPCATPAQCVQGNVWSLFDASGVQVTARCWSFSYQGAWSVTAKGELRVVGSFFEQIGNAPVPARPAVLVGIPTGTDLLLSVQDSAGLVLQGPMTLLRLSAGQAASAQTCSAS